MHITRHKPAPDLAPYVYEYTIVRTTTSLPVEKCVPDGFIKLFIYTGSNKPIYYDAAGNKKDWGDGFSGHPVDEAFYVHIDEPIEVIVCSFKPQGIFHLYNVPIHLLNNGLLSSDTLMGYDAGLLKEQLHEAVNDTDKIAVINRYFRKLAQKAASYETCAISYAQDIIIAKNGMVNIDHLSDNISTTRRSLERNFIKKVGVTPKYFARILRFQYAFSQKQMNPACSWQDIIYDCGYFDQSHFIKDFRHFTDASPESFYRGEHPARDICAGRDR